MTEERASDANDPQNVAGPPQASAHPQQQEMPLAMVHGQPVLQIPQDLYIPPDALEVILEAFEGPLDLLLYLIRRQNLDILDIPVAEITRQYVEYIQAMHEMRFELAAEYLVMAAILARDSLDAGESGTSVLYAGVGAGVLVGFMLLGRIGQRVPIVVLLLAGYLVSSLGNLLTGLAWAVVVSGEPMTSTITSPRLSPMRNLNEPLPSAR